MANPSDRPWPEIESRYIEGYMDDKGRRIYPSLAQVAEYFDVPVGTIQQQAKRNQWTAQRAEFQAEVERQRVQAVAAKVVGSVADFDSECLDLAQVGIARIRKHFETLAKYAAHMLTHEDQDSLEAVSLQLKVLMDPIDLDRLSRALERFQKIGRLAMGQSTEHVHETIEEANKAIDAIANYKEVFDEISKKAS